jgi:CRP-like cAMP-binding protein
MSLKLDLSTPRAGRHSATARAASEVEAEILPPTEFLDQLAGSPRAARELFQRLSQRLREADDRIVNYERRNGRALGTRKDAESQTAVESVNNAYLAAKNTWLQRQFHTRARRPAVRRWPGSCRTGRAAAVAARPQAR